MVYKANMWSFQTHVMFVSCLAHKNIRLRSQPNTINLNIQIQYVTLIVQGIKDYGWKLKHSSGDKKQLKKGRGADSLR